MPILAPEPMLWPEALLETHPDGNPAGEWWVLHVKPRSEKALARKCYRRQSGFYLPQCQERHRRFGRVREAYLPLFPGYVFLFGTERDRILALETNLVANVLTVPNQNELVEDLRRIHRVIESGLPMLPADRLQPGMPAAIVEGPLAGLRGTVLRRKNRVTLTLQVSFLQKGASVELESWMVEPILERCCD